MNRILTLGAIMLITGCKSQHIIDVIDMPYCDANTTTPAIELTQVARTDASTELTFMALYDYYDFNFPLENDISIVAGDFKAPLKQIQGIGNTIIENNVVVMLQGVPSQFKLIFPPLPDDVTSFDFIQRNADSAVTNSIWGIDLTGKRSPNDDIAEIPSSLLPIDLESDTIPRIVSKKGISRITAHAMAWRDWMDRSVNFSVIDLASRKDIDTTFDENGVVTIGIPLESTASVTARTPYNTWETYIVDPGEEINIYVLPDNSSESHRFGRPRGISDGKYRNVRDLCNQFIPFQLYSDSLLVGKTDSDDYFAAMMKIHSDGLDSIRARDFGPNMERYIRSRIDRRLLIQAIKPEAYTPDNWDERDAAVADAVFRFTPEQVRQIRSRIDFSNPMFDLFTIGLSTQKDILRARQLLLAE